MKDEEKDEIKKLIAEFDVPKTAAKPGKGKGGKGTAASKAAGSGSTTQSTLFASPAQTTTSGW